MLIQTTAWIGHITPLLQAIYGFLAAWTYLRFLQPPTIQGLSHGDRSEQFAFVSFFPERVRPALRPLSRGVYRVMVRAGVVEPVSGDGTAFRDAEEGRGDVGNMHAVVDPLERNAQQESERRRALAMKQLEARLMEQKLAPQAAAASPTMVAPVPARIPDVHVGQKSLSK